MPGLDPEFRNRVRYILGWLVGIGIGFCVVVLATDFVMVIIAGIILAIVALCLIKYLTQKLKLPRWGSFGLAWLLILGAPFGLLAVTLPNLQAQFSDFSTQVTLEEIAASPIGSLPGFDLLAENLSVPELMDWFATSTLAGRAGGLALSAVGVIVGAFLLVFVAVYGSFDPAAYEREVRILAPIAWSTRIVRYYPMVEQTLARWVLGRLMSMTVVAALTYIGLLALGIDLALLLSALAGLLSFVPNLGPILSLLPAIAVVITQDPALILWVIGLYIAVQAVESYLITPFIEQWSVDIPPATLLIAQAILGVLFGLVGVVLAGPLMALVVAIVTAHKAAESTG